VLQSLEGDFLKSGMDFKTEQEAFEAKGKYNAAKFIHRSLYTLFVKANTNDSAKSTNRDPNDTVNSDLSEQPAGFAY
jgi:hypothetical protein